MAVEDQRYEELLKALNTLRATGRQGIVRVWLIKLAIDILDYYGYEVVERSDN